jgi:cytochrome c oxidase assembly protein subunit 20
MIDGDPETSIRLQRCCQSVLTMAADTREDRTTNVPGTAQEMPSSAPGTAHEPPAVPVAPPNANALPGGSGLNTAGGKTKEAGVFDAVRSIKLEDFKEVHKKPCVRDSLLTGIGGGFGIGGIRAILGGVQPLYI